MWVDIRMKKIMKNAHKIPGLSVGVFPNSFNYSTPRLLMNALKRQEKYSCLANTIGKISHPNLPSHLTPDLPYFGL